jgi:DNA polymerase-1
MIKIAMVNLSQALKTHRLQSRLLLQVHDELICEVPPGEQQRMKEVDAGNAGSAALDAIRVDAGIGPNWLEAK